ncbi:MAG: hypothetical protein J6Y43_02690 [Clostridia bacterium]|nr:hypothetical protein [Clostridia bacterium]
MKTIKFITGSALFCALLIGVQLALSGVPGIVLVTAFFLAFCFCMGVLQGVVVGVSFSLLRCLLFGFFPTVIILYLLYYSLFALVFGFVGKKFGNQPSPVALFTVIVLSVLMTAIFSLMDDVITPLVFGFDKNAFVAYFYSSLAFMLPQCVCAAVSVGLLFIPLVKTFSLLK